MLRVEVVGGGGAARGRVGIGFDEGWRGPERVVEYLPGDAQVRLWLFGNVGC